MRSRLEVFGKVLHSSAKLRVHSIVRPKKDFRMLRRIRSYFVVIGMHTLGFSKWVGISLHGYLLYA